MINLPALSATIMVKPISYFLLVFLTIGFASAQQADSVRLQRTTPKTAGKNVFYVYAMAINFFDGNGFFKNTKIRYSSNIGDGVGYAIGYSHQFAEQDGLFISAGRYVGYYPFQNSPRCNPNEGIVKRRAIGMFAIEYARTLFLSNRFRISASAGLQYRSGFESVNYQECPELVSPQMEAKEYYLNDFGLTAGSQLTAFFSRSIQLRGGLQFSEYFYRNDHSKLPLFTNYAGKGATRHMGYFSLGLGFGF